MAKTGYRFGTGLAEFGTNTLLGGALPGSISYIAGSGADAVRNTKQAGKSNTEALISGGSDMLVNAALLAAGSAAVKELKPAALAKYSDDVTDGMGKAGKNGVENSGGVGYNDLKSAGSKWFKSDGTPKWPDNDGFTGAPSKYTLQPGARIDRYGDNKVKFGNSGDG